MVYLLHFDRPFKHARHAVVASGVLYRVGAIVLDVRAFGKSPLLAAAQLAGIHFTIAKSWTGTDRAVTGYARPRRVAETCPICHDRAATLDIAVGREAVAHVTEAPRRGY